MVWLSDFRALRRSFRRSPGPVVAIWLCTAIWIAVAPAFLTLLAILGWKSLPFPQSDRIVQINAGLDLVPLLAAGRRFTAVAGYEAGWLVAEGPRTTQTVVGAAVDPGFFEALKIRPRVGRVFSDPREPSEDAAAVVTESLYRRLFGPGRFAGRASLHADGHELAILGIVPDHPVFPARAELWVSRASPVRVRPDFLPEGVMQLGIAGRLAEGVSTRAAYEVVERAAGELFGRTGVSSGDLAVTTFEKVLRWEAQGERGVLAVSLAGLLALLLFGMTSALSGFLLEREGELAVRMALGAQRVDLMRLVLFQMALFAGPGLLAGFPLSIFLLARLSGVVPAGLAALLPPRLDGSSLSLALAGWLVAVLSSTLLAWLSAAPGGTGSLLISKDRRTRRARRNERARLGLVCVALSLAVTVGALAAVLRHSLERLEREPLGFEPQGTVSAVLRLEKAPAAAHASVMIGRLLERLQSVPGVRSISFTDAIPFGSSARHTEISLPDGSRFWMARLHGVHGDPLGALGIRLVAGRDISPPEQRNGAPVALLDARGAREIFGVRLPLGRMLRVGDDLVQIVGIVAPTRFSSFEEPARPQVYRPLLRSGAKAPTTFAAILRLSAPARAERLSAALAGTGAHLSQYRSLAEGIETSVSHRRLARDLAMLQWMATLCLVALATFGTFSWLLEVRSFEFAVRLALGDTRAGIVRRVFREAAWMVGAATLLGLTLYIPAGQALRAFLYGTALLSPAALLEAVLISAGVALAAMALATRGALRRLSLAQLSRRDL